jgi:hypothetical protein
MSDHIKIKYWWDAEKKWFCIIANDGMNEATVSLTPEEASLLSMNAVIDEPAATPAVVVPNEPTPEMLVAGRMADEDCDMPGQVYRAMIAAAPSQRATPTVGGEAMRDLVEKLRNPMWVHSSAPFNGPQLAQEENLAAMSEAADALAAQPASPLRESHDVPYPVYKAVERILDENSAWIARPSDEVTKRIALAATVVAHSIIAASPQEQPASPLRGREPDIIGVLKSVHSALDDALGDTDISHIESDDELRDEAPVQWAAQWLAHAIELLSASPPEQPASPLRGRDLLEAALKHIDFDGMDPNTFTIAELRRAL